MFNGFKMKSFHSHGVDKRGPWVSSGKCEFKDGRAVGIEVWRMRNGEWDKSTEEPLEDSYELLQLMFVAEMKALEIKEEYEKRVADSEVNRGYEKNR